MPSKLNQRNDAIQWLPTLLSSIDITDRSKDPNSVLKKNNYFICGQFEKQVGIIEIVLCNRKYAEEVLTRLTDWGITESSVVPFKRNNTQSKLHLTVKEILEVKTLFKEKPAAVIVKSKEQVFIEELLTGKNLAPTIKLKEEGWVEITFPTIGDYQKAENILGEKNIDCVTIDGTLLVLVAIPDELLAKKRTENQEEKIERNVAEYATRLKFFLSKVLFFSVHTTFGCKHKGENCVSISGTNGSRRLDFHGPKQREIAEVKLIEAGFFCEKPINGEKDVLIVNLKKSTQKELLQNIESSSEISTTIETMTKKELPKTGEIQKVLKAHNIEKTSGFTSGNRFYFYFKDESTAKEAFGVIGKHFSIPGLKTSRKGISFPSESITTNANKGSAKKNPPNLEKVNPVTKTEPVQVTETMDSLFERMKTMMTESAAALEKKNSELEARLKKLKDDYILFEKGVDLEFPAQELGVGITTIGGKIVIGHKLLLEHIKAL